MSKLSVLNKMLILSISVIALNVALVVEVAKLKEPLTVMQQLAIGIALGTINGMSVWWLGNGGRWWKK